MSEWGAIITVCFYLAFVTALLGTVLVSWSSAAEKQRVIEEAQKDLRYAEENRLRRLEEGERRRIEKERLREFLKGPDAELALFLSALFPRLGEALLSGRISIGQTRAAAVGIAGSLLGGFAGFLARPSAPLVGQLPLEAVITRGAWMQGLDQVLVPLAQSSFNMMAAGALIGAVVAAIIGLYVLPSFRGIRQPSVPPVAESMGAPARTGERGEGATMNDLTRSAIVMLVASACATLWGYWYSQTHAMEAVGVAFFGGSAGPTYVMAQWAMVVGVLAFLLGIGLLIAGLNRSGSSR